MKTLFIASGPISWASARLRCYWPAEYMQGAWAVTWDEGTAEDCYNADVVIFQKTFDAAIAKALRGQGKKIYWDLCDPLWWFSPDAVRANLAYVDGVVLSNENLRDDFRDWSGGEVKSWCIPDRLKLEHYPLKREHKDVSPVRLIWFGLSVNRWAVLSALANLERLAANGYKIELTIMDDVPGPWRVTDAFPIYHVQWSLDHENEVIAAHDIALLPPYPGPWGIVKSNNRMLTAWACGLPFNNGLHYQSIERMVKSAECRTEMAGYGARELQREYLAEQSAREWEAILCA